MNPLRKTIVECLVNSSFEIDFVDTENLKISRHSDISDHCLNTLNQLLFLTQGPNDGKVLLSHIRFTNSTPIHIPEICPRLIITVENLFNDHATIEAYLEKRPILVIEKIEELSLRLKDQLQTSYFTSDIACSQTALIHPILDYAQRIRSSQFSALRKSVLQNESILSNRKGYMYYVLIRFELSKVESRIHAFAIQQRLSAEKRPQYFLWHSWYRKFSVLDEKGYQPLLERTISTFLDDLVTIFTGKDWSDLNQELWTNWFSVPVFDYLRPFDTVEFPHTGSSLTLNTTSMCFTVGQYNPSSIHTTVKSQFNKLLKITSKVS